MQSFNFLHAKFYRFVCPAQISVKLIAFNQLQHGDIKKRWLLKTHLLPDFFKRLNTLLNLL